MFVKHLGFFLHELQEYCVTDNAALYPFTHSVGASRVLTMLGSTGATVGKAANLRDLGFSLCRTCKLVGKKDFELNSELLTRNLQVCMRSRVCRCNLHVEKHLALYSKFTVMISERQ